MDEEIEFNPSGRRLCPDGSCVGLLDATGRCGECGQSFPEAADTSAPASDTTTTTRLAVGGGVKSPSSSSSPTAKRSDSGFDASRRLCDDGSCIGVVTADGACNVCGRVARS